MVLVPLHPSAARPAGMSAPSDAEPKAALVSAPVITTTSSIDKPLINLLRGWPAPSILPVAQLNAATADVLADQSVVVDSLQYGPDAGFQPLRESLASYLSQVFSAYDVPNDPNRICITGGASQNAACILQSFTDPAYTNCVWVSAPCYFLMCPIFEDSGFAGRLRAVPEDDEGINVEALERGFREFEPPAQPGTGGPYKTNLTPDRKAYRHVVYVVPTSSNPSGSSMSAKRREQLVRVARKYDALLIADDVYDFLQWDVPRADAVLANKQGSVALPPLLPRLVDVDRMLPRDDEDEETEKKYQGKQFGNAISNASFSKIVAPGFRTGWVEATPAFAYGLAQTGSSKSGGAPSQFGAATIAVLMRTGELDRYLRETVRPTLQWRHRLLTQAVQEHLSEFLEIKCGGLPSGASAEVTTYGGYFLWLKLRRTDISAAAVSKLALSVENLVIADGKLFEVKGDEKSAQFDDHIRLCFAWEDEDKIVEGVQRLARIFRDWDALQEKGLPSTGALEFK
ncbi:Valine--pyruvate aminotransferase [Sporothrix stenoceras]|uniref:Valine--pyruvate aminotransferase n=1 Tax=Sporothrix stenoceras TaxID=5173 RepID=A0ABR3ZNM5_9PEZI